MIKISRKIKFLSLPLAAAGLMFIAGGSAQVSAQRDPFAKPGGGAPRTSGAPRTGSSSAAPAEKPKPAAPTVVMAPPIQERIAYYKRLREMAVTQNQPVPNPTVVMTLDELSVTGIFKTPRGYAAMVEAKPIKLSYTIHPGEKFFDGQLVAIEENRLVFRKVTKMTDGKFLTAEENKPLREYTMDQQVQGTSPADTPGRIETAGNAPSANPTDDKSKPAASGVMSSPLEEMNRQPVETKDSANADKKVRNGKGKKSAPKTASTKKTEKKPVKVAAANTDE